MNLPNKLTLTRICMIPLFIVAFFLPYDWAYLVAAIIFVLAAFTDFLDGHIARKYGLVTDFGKLLDPVADKILVTAALFCLVSVDPFQWFAVLRGADNLENLTEFASILLAVGSAVILARELLLDGVRMIAASKGTVVQANVFGKIKTILQDVTIPVMIVLCEGRYLCAVDEVGSRTGYIWYEALWYAALILFSSAVLMTMVSGIIYLVQNKSVFEDR